MPKHTDFAELMASRLVHELVGPVGGVSAGIEMLGETGEADPETLALLADSSGRASQRLQFFRLAYGCAGRAPIGLDMLKSAVDGYLEKSSVSGLWSMKGDEAVLRKEGAGKCLLLAVEIAAASLLRGGRLSITAGGTETTVTARGTQATLRDEIAALLRTGGPEDDVSANRVHAAYLYCLVNDIGGRIFVETDTDTVTIRLLLPA
ncbi:MAG: histidine phosphotransferase family protein [Alphaproteobacteria bacterium]